MFEHERTAQSFADARMRQLLAHSTLYYKLDKSLIADHVFDRWSAELAELLASNPRLLEHSTVPEAFLFQGFDGSTGMHLADTEFGRRVAARLLEHAQRQA